jgi:hypothetical protein
LVALNDRVLVTNRWDWFTVPFEWGKALAQREVPGVTYKDGRFLVHRTHLPLLIDHPGVPEFIGSIGTSEAFAARDRAADVDLTLRPWQATGLDWLLNRRGALLADEQRLGKTAASLLSHDPARGPLVVIAPLDTRPVWARWFAQIFPGVPVTYITGKTLELGRFNDRPPIIFGHYDVLSYHQSTGLQPGTLILDEAHLLSNPKSRRTKAVLFFAGIAKRVIVLSGTPLWNTSRGLWALLAAAAPGAWGNLHAFAQRYCSPELTEYGWRYGGVSNREEWLARRGELVLARTWRGVLPDLPPIQREIVRVPVDRDASLAVDLAAVELAKAGKENLPITVLGRYRQAVGKFKIDPVVEMIDRREGPIVVWVWHKTIARAIEKRLEGEPVYVMTGDDTGARRADTIDLWNDTPRGVLIATLAVGQVGIDLSHADDEIFVEVDWTPAVLSQAEMRTFHPDRPMRVRYVVLEHEIDEALLAAILKKLERGGSLDIAAAGSSFSELVDDNADKHSAEDLLRDLGEILLRAA